MSITDNRNTENTCDPGHRHAGVGRRLTAEELADEAYGDFFHVKAHADEKVKAVGVLFGIEVRNVLRADIEAMTSRVVELRSHAAIAVGSAKQDCRDQLDAADLNFRKIREHLLDLGQVADSSIVETQARFAKANKRSPGWVGEARRMLQLLHLLEIEPEGGYSALPKLVD